MLARAAVPRALALCLLVSVGESADPEPPPALEQGAVPDLDGVFRGMEGRAGLVSSARGMLVLEVIASDEYRAQYAAELKESLKPYGVPLPEIAPRDVACASFAYDEKQYVWHLGLANTSGMDWWGIHGWSGVLTPGEPRPTLGALVIGGASDGTRAYKYDASTRTCRVADVAKAPDPEPIGIFKARFVEQFGQPALNWFRSRYSPRLLGSCDHQGRKCFVIAGGGTNDPPKGLRRLWVSQDHFIVLRQEHVEIGADGKPATCSSQTVSNIVEAAPGVWLPTEVRVDSMGVIEGKLTWRFTKRYQLCKAEVNQGVHLTPADYLFSPSFRWRDGNTKQLLWDGGGDVVRQPLHPVEDRCDTGLLDIAAHAEDVERWMMRPPE